MKPILLSLNQYTDYCQLITQKCFIVGGMNFITNTIRLHLAGSNEIGVEIECGWTESSSHSEAKNVTKVIILNKGTILEQ